MDYIDELDLYQDIEKRGSPQDRLLDQHLSSPIRLDLPLMLKERIIIHPHRTYVSGVSQHPDSYVCLPYLIEGIYKELDSWLDVHLYGSNIVYDSSEIYGDILKQVYAGVSEFKWIRQNIPQVVGPVLDLIKTMNISLLSEFDDVTSVGFNDREIKAYSAKIRWEDIKLRITELTAKNKKSDTLIETNVPGLPYIHITRTLSYIISCEFTIANLKIDKLASQLKGRKFKVYIMTYEQIMMLSDTLSGRFFVLYYSRLLNNNREYKIDPDILIQIFSIIDDGFRVYGNDLYKQLKLYEGLCHALIITKKDTYRQKDKLLRFILDEIKENEYHIMVALYSVLETCNVWQLAELHGLYRLWGHPIVDEERGCTNVYNIASTRTVCNRETLINITAELKKQFISSYISKHGRWPYIEPNSIPKDSVLGRFIKQNKKHINFYTTLISQEDWASLKIVNALVFDYNLDYTVLLSDRAIATLTSDIQTCYNSEMSGIATGLPKTSRRLLCEILSRQEIDMRKICDTVRLGHIPEDWKNIRLASKEREINIVPRLFAMMVMEMRLYFCVTESNISNTVFQYYPQQSMTLDESKVIRKLIDFSSAPKLNQPGRVTIELVVGIDFKKWNIHWSIFSTYMVFEFLDQLFAIPGMFTRTHLFFQQCKITLNSKFKIPDEYMNQSKPYFKSAGRYSWVNHLGGFEGIRQKGWTLITIGLLLETERQTGIKSTIIGQGDNQLCKLQIPLLANHSDYPSLDDLIEENSQVIQAKVDHFITTLQRLANDIGLEIKELESWVSHNVLIYGKEIYIGGVLASQGLKRVSRTLPDISQMFPTIVNKVSTLQTSGLSTTTKTYEMALPYFLCQTETILTIIRDRDRLSSKNSGKLKLYKNICYNANQITFFLLLNSDIHGIPMNTLLSYYYRGHPDPLTNYTSYLYHLKREKTPTGVMADKIYRWLESRSYELGSASKELLISNPASTNIKRVDPVNYECKKIVKNYIVNTSKNKNISEIFNHNNESFANEMYDWLMTFSPKNPKVMHEISGHSIPGAISFMISKFSSTNTFQGMATTLNGKTMQRIMMESDSLLFDQISSIYDSTIVERPEPLLCPTQLADDIRNYSWASILDGEKISGVTVPHPIHQFSIDYEDDPSIQSYISFTTNRKLDITDILSPGINPPLTGSKTHEKKSGKVFTADAFNRPIKDSIRLSQINSWAINQESKAYDIVRGLIKSRTNIPPEIILRSGGEIGGGSIEHRLNDHQMKMSSSPSHRATFTTHIKHSTDKLGLTIRGGEDWNIHIQGAVLFTIRNILINTMDGTLPLEYIKAYIKGNCCMRQILDIRCSTEAPLNIPVAMVHNPLIYTEVKDTTEDMLPYSKLISYTTSDNSANAVAMCLVSKYGTHVSTRKWGKENENHYHVSNIGMYEVLNIGIKRIVDNVAEILISYLDIDPLVLSMVVKGLPKDFWAGVSEFCTLPTIIHDILPDGEDGIINAYTNKGDIVRLLNTRLSKSIIKIHNAKSYTNRVYYPAEGFSLPVIISTWASYLVNKRKIDQSVKDKISDYIGAHSYSNNHILMNGIFTLLRDNIDHMTLIDIVVNHPIKISKCSVENNFRSTKYPILTQPMITAYPDIDDDIIYDIIESPYAQTLIIQENFTNIGYCYVPVEGKLHTHRYEDKIRSRMDHAYRNYSTVSSAPCKYLQIIIKENIELINDILCTADGEGGVAYSLAMLSKKPVYFNTLIDKSELTSQRYVHYVPAAFHRNRDKILLHEYSAKYGGDLRSDSYIDILLSKLPSKLSLITCDAEVSSTFNTSDKLQIYNSILRLISNTECTAVIVKDYLGEGNLLTLMAASMQLIYSTVKIIVPMFSSFEGSECFLVCKGYNPRVDIKEIISGSSILCSSNYNKTFAELMNLDYVRNDFGRPFQELNLISAGKLNKLCSCMGFSDNSSYSLSKLIDIDAYNVTRENLYNILDQAERKIKLAIIAEVDSYGGSLTGSGESHISHILSMISKSPKRFFEICGETLINIEIIRSIMPIEDQNRAYEVIIQHVNKNIRLDIQGHHIFKMRVNKKEWFVRCIKHVWHVWGGLSVRRVH